MKRSRALLAALLLTGSMAGLLSGCATTAPSAPPESLFADRLFAPLATPIRTEQIFAVSPAMRRYLRSDISEQLRTRGRALGLAEALYTAGKLKLDYDAVVTRNAAEAFDARAGNCLSLVIMTAALARELDLGVRFQSVAVEDAWSRDGELFFVNGHVNLAITSKSSDQYLGLAGGRAMIIDFMPLPPNRRQNAQPIGEQTIVAMYLNNRAAELLARHQLDEAYWWAREAVLRDPDFLAARNTLGVIYRQHRNPAEAESAFASVLARDAGNLVAMSNLSHVLGDIGRHAEAQALAAKVAARQPHPPYVFFDLGMAAMRAQQFVKARDLFAQEVERAAYNPEFHFWLASAHAALGEWKPAQAHLAVAMQNSTSRRDHDIYAAKLDRIKAYQYQQSPSVATGAPR